MKIRNTKHKEFNKILGYFFVILCLLSTAVMYNFILPRHLNPTITRMLLVIVCAMGILFQRKISPITPVFIFLIIFYLLIYIIFTRYNVKEFLVIFLVPFVAICAYCIETVKEGNEQYIINAFINIMTVISAVSLFFWIFGTVFGFISPTKNVSYVRGNLLLQSKTYYFIYFSNAAQKFGLFGKDAIRNVGIFSEAPSFASPLLYAIGGELLYNRKRINRTKLAFLIAATVSTLSSKGFIGLILILIIEFLFYHKAKNRITAAIKICVSLVVLFGGGYIISIILIEKSDFATGVDRIQDLQAAFRAFAASPVFGVGFDNFDAVHSLGSSTEKGMSMGIPTLMAYGGIYLLTIFLLPLFVIVFRKNSIVNLHKKEVVLFSLIVLFDFFISLMHTNPCLFMVVGFAYGIILKKGRMQPAFVKY